MNKSVSFLSKYILSCNLCLVVFCVLINTSLEAQEQLPKDKLPPPNTIEAYREELRKFEILRNNKEQQALEEGLEEILSETLEDEEIETQDLEEQKKQVLDEELILPSVKENQETNTTKEPDTQQEQNKNQKQNKKDQQNSKEDKVKEKSKKEKIPFEYYLGIDLSKPLRTALSSSFLADNVLISEGYRGYALQGMLRVTKNGYISADVGYERFRTISGYSYEKEDKNENKETIERTYLNQLGSGMYFDFGWDQNIYKNWSGMRNLITVGGHIGLSRMRQQMQSYRVYTTTDYISLELVENTGIEDYFTNVWISFVVGFHVEVFQNVFLVGSIHSNFRMYFDRADNIENLFVSGYGTTNDYEDLNFRISYGLRYLF